MRRFYTSYNSTGDLYERALEYAKSHPYPECWGFGAIGAYCPDKKPTLQVVPLACKGCPLYKPKKLKKHKSGGSGGYGDV